MFCLHKENGLMKAFEFDELFCIFRPSCLNYECNHRNAEPAKLSKPNYNELNFDFEIIIANFRKQFVILGKCLSSEESITGLIFKQNKNCSEEFSNEIIKQLQ